MIRLAGRSGKSAKRPVEPVRFVRRHWGCAKNTSVVRPSVTVAWATKPIRWIAEWSDCTPRRVAGGCDSASRSYGSESFDTFGQTGTFFGRSDAIERPRCRRRADASPIAGESRETQMVPLSFWVGVASLDFEYGGCGRHAACACKGCCGRRTDLRAAELALLDGRRAAMGWYRAPCAWSPPKPWGGPFRRRSSRFALLATCDR